VLLPLLLLAAAARQTPLPGWLPLSAQLCEQCKLPHLVTWARLSLLVLLLTADEQQQGIVCK
jgi:hypothetical protein